METIGREQIATPSGHSHSESVTVPDARPTEQENAEMLCEREARPDATLAVQQETSKDEEATMKRCICRDDSRKSGRSEDMKNELQRANSEIRNLQSNLRIAEAEQKQWQRIADEKHRSLTALENIHRDTIQLLKTRSMELQDAQKYLNSIDTLSDSDVLRLFENLNSQAFQTSARIADTVKFSLEGNEAKLQGWMEMSKASVVESVGETMMKLLEFRRHDEDPICVQIAIQCCVASFTSWLIFAWGLGYDPYLESFGKVLSLTQLPETQTVSGRWRSLAKSHLRLLVEGPSWSGDCTNALLSRIVDVLLVSGAKGPHGEALNEMRHSFGEKINSIILSSLAIRKAIGEEIISRDFEPIFIDCAGRFDMKSMDDAYASSKTDSRPGTHGKRVICTAEMGLQRVESRAAGGEVRAILLKPKVILESMIAELQKTRP